jgi:hypothetical protein
MDRPADRLTKKHRYLIVCEGERTEPNYFLGFPIPKDSVVKVEGTGFNTESLILEAIRLYKQAKDEENIIYDQIWCVFDRDSFSAKNFKKAFQVAEQAKQNKINVEIAYSNEAFELWYVLHFQYLDTGISRADYITCLTKLLKRDYKKKDQGIYKELLPRQDTALKNAQKLYDQYQSKNPESDKPSTTVHILVKKLNDLNWENQKKK